MVYNFSDRLDYCGTRMKELHHVDITYRRRSHKVTIYNVTPEESDSEMLQALGIALINEKWQDFVFDTTELEQFYPPEPEGGDLIIWGSSTFQVVAIGDELYKFVTSSRKRIRVHTKQIR